VDALVTGGSRGIGRAIVHALASRGDRVGFVYLRDRASADAVVAATDDGSGRIWAIQADVRSPEDLSRIADEAGARWGGLDLLVHNAAIGALRPLDRLKLAHWDLTLESSLRPFFWLTRLCLPWFRPGASVVGLSSLGAHRYTPGYVAMGAAKAGMEAMTRQLAVELGPTVRVNTVCGGLVRTDALRAFPDGDRFAAEVEQATPTGRLVTPEDLAQAVLFLAHAPAISGQVVVVDGGFSAR
jgi:enoyl-[acyl-carrier protein] reductase III